MISLVIAAGLSQEPTFSLMLTPEEQGLIKPNKGLTLNAILYQSEDLWTVWINGNRYQPGDQVDDFFIHRVGQHEVEIVVGEDLITLEIGKTHSLTR